LHDLASPPDFDQLSSSQLPTPHGRFVSEIFPGHTFFGVRNRDTLSNSYTRSFDGSQGNPALRDYLQKLRDVVWF
jgi:hypothetical protein